MICFHISATKFQMYKTKLKILTRSSIDVLRVRFWYEGVKLKTGCTTAYQLERLFEPLAAGVDNRTSFRNKWIRYATGKHTPRDSLVRKVEKQVAGSARELDHPLWDILRLENQCPENIDKWLGKLEPRVQAIVYRCSSDKSGQAVLMRRTFSSVLCRQLARLGNLDGLTALLLYWHESYQLDKMGEVRFLARYIYRVLLMIGMEFRHRHVEEAVFEVFRIKVFERTDWQNGIFYLNARLYDEGILSLYLALYQVKDLKPFSSWQARCRAMTLILDGKSGSDACYGLDILLMPNWQDGPPTEKQWSNWHDYYRTWLWGWIHLYSGTNGVFPNDELWNKLVQSNATYQDVRILFEEKKKFRHKNIIMPLLGVMTCV
jgi:hypothetical protein